MQCENCGSRHMDLFFVHHQTLKCRMCLSTATLEPIQVSVPVHMIEDIQLPFELTSKQKEVSQALTSTTARHVMFEAVCGAGKTESVLQLIQDRLNQGLTVGWAIPRRQVVLELQQRLAKVFPTCSVIAVCEGHTTQLSADLVLFTTHQAFRYRGSFDVLILDEVDAFPYKGNTLLQHQVKQTYLKQCIMMSATIPQTLRTQMKEENWHHITCYERPTQVPLVVPTMIRTLNILMWIHCLRVLKKQNKWLIFVPTHAMAKHMGLILRCDYLTSKTQNKDVIISRFISQEHAYLVCTTILERGVTFKNVHVVVMKAHHRVFDESSLVQIAGRVGRSLDYPTGEVLFLISQESEEVNRCIHTLQHANSIAYGV